MSIEKKNMPCHGNVGDLRNDHKSGLAILCPAVVSVAGLQWTLSVGIHAKKVHVLLDSVRGILLLGAQ